VSEKVIKPAAQIKGKIRIPGDKSISHRAAILGLLAEGETRITNFLKAEDCLNTLKACAALGAEITWQGHELKIRGAGLKGLKQPRSVIDCGNSGTGVRLLAGVLAGQPFAAEITGDEQIQRRPMNRIIKPLQMMGARIESRPGGLCPLKIRGGNLKGIAYESPVASAQVKSCVLLAGLFAQGETSILEPALSRDHTEKMLSNFGVELQKKEQERYTKIKGGGRLIAQELEIPSDISSAAFFMVAAILLPGSEITLENVGMNKTRTGIITVLKDIMGADLQFVNEKVQAGEKVADIKVRYKTSLHRIVRVIDADKIPTLIDEIPILAVAAAAVDGFVEIRNASELRVKETDRISVLADELRNIGMKVDEYEDGMKIYGGRIRGGIADSHGDHRLAMSLAIAGLASEKGVQIKNPDCVNTSFPGFWERLEEVGL